MVSFTQMLAAWLAEGGADGVTAALWATCGALGALLMVAVAGTAVMERRARLAAPTKPQRRSQATKL